MDKLNFTEAALYEKYAVFISYMALGKWAVHNELWEWWPVLMLNANQSPVLKKFASAEVLWVYVLIFKWYPCVVFTMVTMTALATWLPLAV